MRLLLFKNVSIIEWLQNYIIKSRLIHHNNAYIFMNYLSKMEKPVIPIDKMTPEEFDEFKKKIFG